MKAFVLVSFLLIAGLMLAGCSQQAVPTGNTQTPSDTASADQQAASTIDSAVVADNDTVQLGELI